MKKDWLFHYVIEQITEDQADQLENLMLDWLDDHEIRYGGGHAPNPEKGTEDDEM